MNLRYQYMLKWTGAMCAVLLLTQSMTCRPYCPEKHTDILVINNSQRDIIYRGLFDDSVYLVKEYPPADNIVVKANGTVPEQPYGGCMEDIFADGYYQYAFFFDPDTVMAIGWYAIGGTHRGLLKRVKVDSAYVYDNDFRIVYP